MTSLLARLVHPQAGDGHARVQVFAGPDADHRALCGTLTMRPEEADALIAVLASGGAQTAPPSEPALPACNLPTCPEAGWHRITTGQCILVPPDELPTLVINPGSGALAGGNEMDATVNMATFLGDVAFLRQQTPAAARAPELDDYGRYAFRVTVPGTDEAYLVEMPGLRLSSVRWMGPDSGNIFDFPRLYVDGSSWVWKYAVSAIAPPEGD